MKKFLVIFTTFLFMLVTPLTVHGAHGGSSIVICLEKVFEQKEGYTPDPTKVEFVVKACQDMTSFDTMAYDADGNESPLYEKPIYIQGSGDDRLLKQSVHYKAGDEILHFNLPEDGKIKLVVNRFNVNNGPLVFTIEEIATDTEYETDTTPHTLLMVADEVDTKYHATFDGKELTIDANESTGYTFQVLNNLVIENKVKSEKPEIPETPKEEEQKAETPKTTKKKEEKPTEKKEEENSETSYPETGIETYNPLSLLVYGIGSLFGMKRA